MTKKIVFEERVKIEVGIIKEESFKSIAKDLGRSASSISREVKVNRIFEPESYHFNNNCLHAKDCIKIHLCGDMNCPFPCKTCRKRVIIGECCTRCDEYVGMTCTLIDTPPYVCNSCQHKGECEKDKYFYSAKDAENNSYKTRSESRRSPQLDDISLRRLDKTITPLIKENHQSLAHICATKRNKIPVSLSSLYRYINGMWMTVRNIDLPRKAH